MFNNLRKEIKEKYIIIKKHCKGTDEKGIKLVSNSPKSDINYYGGNCEILHSKIHDDVSVKNIGLLSSYGAGKSSLLETYKEKYSLSDNKVLTISLANFNASDILKQCKNPTDDERKAQLEGLEGEVEKSVLQQILYKVPKSKLPMTKVKRIHTGFKSSFLFACMVALAIFSILCFALEFTDYNFFKFNGSSIMYLVVALLSVAFIVFCLIINDRIKSVSIGKVSANVTGEEKMVLNGMIDEVLYFFERTKYNLVIIEDLDRFDDLNIFCKLRELNNTINNYVKINRKVVFLYAVKDTMFKTEEEKAKFFEFSLSLVPYITPNNVREILGNTIDSTNVSELKLDSDYLGKVAYFISDMRIMNNIVNDYVLFYNMNKSDTVSRDASYYKCLFALVMYKNLEPIDFASLQKNEGVLANIFKNKKLSFYATEEKLKAKIIELNNIYNSTITFKQLKMLVSGVLLKHGKNINVSYEDIKTLTSFKKFLDDTYLSDSDVSTHEYNSYHGYVKQKYYMTVNEVEKILGGASLAERELAINNGAEKDNIEQEIKKLSEYISKISNMTIKEYIYINEGFLSEVSSLFIRTMLKLGYIDENYLNYITIYGKGLLTHIDRDYIQLCNAGEIKYETQIDNPRQVILELSNEMIASKSMLNKNVLNAYSDIFISSDQSDDLTLKKNIFMKWMTSDNNDVNKCLIIYFSRTVNERLLIKLLSIRKNIMELFISEITDKIVLNEIIAVLFRNCSKDTIGKQNANKVITNYINGLSNAVDYFKHSLSLIDFTILNDLELKINNINGYACGCEISHCIRDNSLYELNINNLLVIINTEYNKVSSLSYSNIINTGCIPMINYINENINLFINEILSQDRQVAFSDNEVDIIYLLKNVNISDEQKDEIIMRQTNKIEYRVELTKSQLVTAIKCDKLVLNMKAFKLIFASLHKNEMGLINNLIENNLSNFDINKIVDDKDLYLLINNEERLSSGKLLIETIDLPLGFVVQMNKITSDDVLVCLINQKVIGFEGDSYALVMTRSNRAIAAFINTYEQECIVCIVDVTWPEGLISKIILEKTVSTNYKCNLIEKKQNDWTMTLSSEVDVVAELLINNDFILNEQRMTFIFHNLKSVEHLKSLFCKETKSRTAAYLTSIISCLDSKYNEVIDNGELVCDKELKKDEIIVKMKQLGLIKFGAAKKIAK